MTPFSFNVTIRIKNTSAKPPPPPPPRGSSTKPKLLALCSYFHSQSSFSSQAIRALWISAHQIHLIDGRNPGAGPRNNLKKRKTIIFSEMIWAHSTPRLLSILNSASAVSLPHHAEVWTLPRADKAPSTRGGAAQACITLKYRIKVKLATFKQTRP